ncbi:MAG: MFS transporter [Chloroflexi bacterium]|nr:MFS transporter [Chloroflexota bacterium]
MMEAPMMQGGRSGAAVLEGEQRGLFSLQTFASFRNRNYRFYYGALVCQMAAMNMQMMANAWFIYELSRSASLLGVLALANAVPMLALGLFGGVIADRVQKKWMLVLEKAGLGAIVLGIALSITFGVISPLHLIVGAALQGIVMALAMPSRQAIIPEIVGERGLMNAVALNTAAMNLLRLLAPAMAGFLIALWNVQGVYFIMFGLNALGILFILPLPLTTNMADRGRTRILEDLTAGLRYVRENKNIFAVLVLTLLAVLLSMPYIYLLPIFTKEILIVEPGSLGALPHLPVVGRLFASLGESSARLGLLISVSGVGAFVGSLLVASMGSKGRGMLYLHSVLVTGLALLTFALLDSYALALVVFVPMGFAQAGRMALATILLQAYSEDAYRGRVMSLFLMEWGLTSFGSFGAALLAESQGVQLAIGGTAALLVGVAVLYYLFSPRIRRLD